MRIWSGCKVAGTGRTQSATKLRSRLSGPPARPCPGRALCGMPKVDCSAGDARPARKLAGRSRLAWTALSFGGNESNGRPFAKCRVGNKAAGDTDVMPAVGNANYTLGCYCQPSGQLRARHPQLGCCAAGAHVKLGFRRARARRRVGRVRPLSAL
jgi:hypothetical protein